MTAVRAEPLGAGYGLLGALRRLHLRWEHSDAGGPETLVNSPANSTHAGQWSAGFSQPRVNLSTPACCSLSAACGDSRR